MSADSRTERLMSVSSGTDWPAGAGSGMDKTSGCGFMAGTYAGLGSVVDEVDVMRDWDGSGRSSGSAVDDGVHLL